jgi:hypothetical protein
MVLQANRRNLSQTVRGQVERTGHASDSLSRNVRVDHRRLQAFMAQENLDGSQIDATLDARQESRRGLEFRMRPW